jgi:chaperonin GroEL
VAKSIEFEDRDINLGAALIKEVSMKTMAEAGDGTTTSTLLARNIYRDGLMAITAGAHPMVLKNQMFEASEIVMKKLEEMSI